MSALEKHTLIVGLGKSGLSCARYLHTRRRSLKVVDSRPQPPGATSLRTELPDVEVHTGGFDIDWFNHADELVISPGVSLEVPAVANAIASGVPVVGDIELFARAVKAPVVAITGTNGKSTVTTLLAEMAHAAQSHYRVGGNLGTPALELLDDDTTELYILELSSFQLETTQSLNAVAAVVLNVAPDHMDRYHDMQHYADTKQRIYAGDGVMVLNRDDDYVRSMHQDARQVRYFTLETPAAGEYGLITGQDESWLALGDERLLAVSEVKLRGRHNYANILAALALADAAGLPRASSLQACREFAGLAHRCQWVAEKAGVNFYNDSKATNVAATVATLRGLERKSVLIAGGQSKESEFSVLRDAVAESAVAVVLIGRDAGLIATGLGEVVPLSYADGMSSAVQQAFNIARVQQADVLLAPACASFDMFNNFEHRGEMFCHAVKGLQQ